MRTTIAIVVCGLGVACSGGGSLTVEETARIIAPPACRRAETCDPQTFAATYPTGSACVEGTITQVNAANGGGSAAARCSRSFWEACARDIDRLSCEWVKTSTSLPSSCTCPQ